MVEVVDKSKRGPRKLRFSDFQFYYDELTHEKWTKDQEISLDLKFIDRDKFGFNLDNGDKSTGYLHLDSKSYKVIYISWSKSYFVTEDGYIFNRKVDSSLLKMPEENFTKWKECVIENKDSFFCNYNFRTVGDTEYYIEENSDVLLEGFENTSTIKKRLNAL